MPVCISVIHTGWWLCFQVSWYVACHAALLRTQQSPRRLPTLTPSVICVCTCAAVLCLQSKLVRIGFEQQLQAQEWYALLSIAMGIIDLDSPTLASLPTALAASKKAGSFKTA